ncbi:MAG: hypothetical protein HZA92_04165 [Verrucomicrobia bacterium]|nr:hypothetical protein [Verrucomicrobiota bacterium]
MNLTQRAQRAQRKRLLKPRPLTHWVKTAGACIWKKCPSALRPSRPLREPTAVFRFMRASSAAFAADFHSTGNSDEPLILRQQGRCNQFILLVRVTFFLRHIAVPKKKNKNPCAIVGINYCLPVLAIGELDQSTTTAVFFCSLIAFSVLLCALCYRNQITRVRAM